MTDPISGPVLLFDLDGTVTDSREGITNCIRYALNDAGMECPPTYDLGKYIGPPLQETFELLLKNDALAAHALSMFRERYGTIGLYENRLCDGIHDALATLNNLSVTMFVATSKPQVFA